LRITALPGRVLATIARRSRLKRAGRYRVTFTGDLKHDASHARLDENLRSLKEQAMIEART